MKELEQILLTHAKRYPKLGPTDAVKLIYQNEFGGGHLIRDAQACMAYLRQEYAEIPKDPGLPLWEDIGNGLVRVNLAAVEQQDLERLGQAFLRSAAACSGDLRRFRDKLDLLRRVTEKGAFAFRTEELEAYLAAYEAAGFPAVSHSREYRDAYHPAYRVILRAWNR